MIKLSEAIRQMNPGDKFGSDRVNIEIDENGIPRFESKTAVSLTPDNLDLEGEIIRAEPEVLTAKDLMRGVYFRSNDNAIFTEKELLKYVRKCDKNGQNKEYKRLKPLIENAKKYFIDGNRAKYEEIQGALMNLTSPWEPEK